MDLLYKSLLYLTGWPLAVVLFAGGLYFTIRTGLIQAFLKESINVTKEKPKTGKISSFSALMVSTASRVGSGNIIGVSVAICSGGPGAVFWMWLTATIGGASAFVESTLAQIFKRKKPDGTSYGGPAYYIESTLKSKFLAIVFTLALIFTYGVGYNMLASYNLQSAFSEFEFYKETANIVWYFGIGVALLFFICVCGGCKSIIKVTSVLVPFMGVAYILFALVSVIINIEQIPGMFKTIFQSAFDFKAIFGGFAGSVIMLGMKRGLYSNEAGIGSAPNAAASADVSHPVKQGLVQMLSVFIDTLVICSATAFMCLCTNVDPTTEGISGAPYVQQAVSSTFGIVGPIFIATAMVLFTFTTLLGNFFYVENCLNYLFGKVPSKSVLIFIRFVGAVLIALGAGIKMGLAWDLADIAQCILAFINIPVCIIVGGYAYKALENYKAQRREGKDPVFKSKDIGIDVPTDFWN